MKLINWNQYVDKKFDRLTVKAILSPDENNKGVRFNCICDCGNKKNISPNWLLRDGRKVKSCGCLRKEAYKWCRKDLTGKKFERWTVERKDTKENYWWCICDCGTRKLVFRGNLTSKTTKSCGCYNAEVGAARIKEKNPNWNPKLTDEDRIKQKKHYGWQFEFSKKVFERDNYTCAVCERRGSMRLAAHHLDGWNWCKEKRFLLENLVTICSWCHKIFHKKYGKGNNTKNQFEQYKEEYQHAI